MNPTQKPTFLDGLADVPAAELRAIIDAQADALRSVAILLRSTADRADSGARVDAATLRYAATAADEISSRSGRQSAR